MLQIVHRWFGAAMEGDPAYAVIGYAVSVGNRCGFCSAGHEAELAGAGLRGVAQAIRDERFEQIADERMRQAALFGYAGFGDVDADWTDAAAESHYANRVANALGMRRKKWWGGRELRGAGLRWREAAADVPAVVSHRVKSHVRAWHGEEPGPNRGWVENYLADLSQRDRAMARLALLTAMASHQVDRTVLEAFRGEVVEDWKLEEVVHWGAWLGARRVIDRRNRGVTDAAA
jgi:AhpD family alkylhydroperoxidase